MSRYLSVLILVALSLPAAAATQRILTQAEAGRIVEAAMAYAHEHAAPGGAIAIVDGGGNLVQLSRLDGSFPAAAEIAMGKARTAALFRKPTSVFEELVNKGRVTMVTLPSVTPFTPLKGGVPIELDGQIVGAIGVSGAASADQDNEIAEAAVAFAKGLTDAAEKSGQATAPSGRHE